MIDKQKISICELSIGDGIAFLSALQRSQSLHHPWVKAPLTQQIL